MTFLEAYSSLLVRSSEDFVKKQCKEFSTLKDTAEVIHILLPYINKIEFTNYDEEKIVKEWVKKQQYSTKKRR